MHFWTRVLVCLAFPLSVWADGLHVVFDLDGTLMQNISEPLPAAEKDQMFKWGDRLYRLNDFAPEVLMKLSEAGYKISFFSGGGLDRSVAVVEKLKEIIRARTGHELKPYKILGEDSLTPIFGRPETARFRERFRKDLQHIDFPGDVVLVDDIKEFVTLGQEKSHLHLSGDFATVRDRQKLLVIMEILLEARDLLKRSPVQYLQAVQGLARDTSPGASYDDEVFVEFMKKALARFGLPLRINEPSYPTYLRVKSCEGVFR